MVDNHSRFLSHLRESNSSVWTVARWLSSKGYPVSIPPTTEAAAHADWKSHADSGDLFITQRIEVKRLSRSFTGRSDWPFGDKFIVCAKHAFDRASPRPFAYVILSSDEKAAAVAKSCDSREWVVEKRVDRRYEGVSQEFYLSPLEYVSFVELGEC